jgi:GNAT superfamily N-acetyltransferase
MTSIITATRNHYPTILTLKSQFYSEMAEVVPSIHKAPEGSSGFFTESMFEGDLLSGTQAYFVALDEQTGAIVGFITIGRRLSPNNPLFTTNSFANIDEIYVAPEFRKQKIATELVKAAFKWATANGLHTVKTGVYARNSGGYQFWEMIGFTAYKALVEIDLSNAAANRYEEYTQQDLVKKSDS